MRTLRSLAALVALPALGCTGTSAGPSASTGIGVPQPSAERLVHVDLTRIMPRMLNVSVTDARRPLPENSDSVVEVMRAAVMTIVGRAGITVDPDAAGSMHMTVKYPDTPLAGFKRAECIELALDLRLVDGTRLTAYGSVACAAPKNPHGVGMGGSATEVYERALNVAMKELDRGLSSLVETAPARRPITGGLADSLAAQRASRGGITWNPRLHLRVKDFQAAPPDSSFAVAVSSVGILSAFRCVRPDFEFGVEAVFIPSESWVKAVVRLDTALATIVLAHERTHFDIAEISAREFRRTLLTIGEPCLLPRSALSDIATTQFNEMRRMQDRYDKETGHGAKATQQMRWTAWARATLDTLGAYSATTGRRSN